MFKVDYIINQRDGIVLNQKPLISVIIPIYNVEAYLDKCVVSLIQQTYSHLEIILVDDGSPDSCPQICDDWAKKDSRIKVIHKQNGGLSDARNAGISVATGEWIVFIDSDDWIENDALEKMFQRSQTDQSDVVSCGVKWVKEDDTLINEVTVSQEEVLDTKSAMREIIVDGKLKQHVWNKLYMRSLVADIPFEKGKYHEDVFWSYQVFGRAKKVSLMMESFYHYIQRSNSIMGESYSPKRLDALDAMCRRCEYVKEYYPDLYGEALLAYINSCMYHLQCALLAKQQSNVIQNIVDRVPYCNSKSVISYASKKQRIWLNLFVRFPVITAQLRNKLKVGI